MARSKSYEDYLHDVAGTSHDLGDDEESSEFRQLDVTTSDADLTSRHDRSMRHRSATPRSLTSPSVTEAGSFVNGLLSPFSPLLKQREQRDEFLQFVSLQNLRKVTVVVRVLPCPESEQRCVFPHVKDGDPSAAVIQKPQSPRDVVVVKPSAFGKVIPAKVTMETARLVAQVSHISSEDWARLYEFHHVMWPEGETSPKSTPKDLFGTMDSLSQAVVQDAIVERQSSLLISMGQAPSCIETVRFDENERNNNGKEKKNSSKSLLSRILSISQQLLEAKAVATISVIELLEERDSFEDVLDPTNSKSLSLKHADMKGAVMQGLTEIPLDQMKDSRTWHQLQRDRRHRHTMVATIHIWDNAVSQQLKRAPDSEITCVELARSADPTATASTPHRNMPSRKKSSTTVSLGLALRQLLLHAHMGTDPAISYRESTITKVLQRSLESSKIVLLASVSQLSQDYNTTLATLNFVRRLLVKPGKTASSPFGTKGASDMSFETTANDLESVTTNLTTATMAEQLQQYAHDERLLEQIIADPRQRLAKVFKQQSPAPSSIVQPIDNASSLDEENYDPIDYMQGLEVDDTTTPQNWKSPVIKANHSVPTSKSAEVSDVMQMSADIVQQVPVEEELWTMQEPNDDVDVNLDTDIPNYSLSDQDALSDEDSDLRRELTPQQERQLFHREGDIIDDPIVQTIAMEKRQTFAPSPHWSEESYLHDGPGDEQPSVDEMAGQDDFPDLDLDGENEEDASDILLGDSMEQQSEEGAANHLLVDHHNLFEEHVVGRQDEDVFDSPGSPDIDQGLSNWSTTRHVDGDDPPDGSDKQSPPQYDLPELDDGFPRQDVSIDDSLISPESRSLPAYSDGQSRIEAPSSLDEDNGDRLRSSPRKQSAFHFTSSSRNSASGSSRSLGRSMERPGYVSYEEQKNVDGDQYLGEIHVLEDAVQHIQNMQSGLWRSSAQSLGKLKETLVSQSHRMNHLTSEREVLSNTVASLKDEIQRNSEEHDSRLQRYEEEVQSLHGQLQSSYSERRRLENLIEEATRKENELESGKERIEKELETKRQEAVESQKSYKSLLEAHGDLQAEAKKIETEFSDLQHEKEATNQKCRRLEDSVATFEAENIALQTHTKSKDAEIRELKKRINYLEDEWEASKERARKLESSRNQDLQELEQLRCENKSLKSSVDEVERVKSGIEDARRSDKQQINQLERQFVERQNKVYELISEKDTMAAQVNDLEQKLTEADHQAKESEATIYRLNEKCEGLENELSRNGSDKSYWEEQSKELGRTVDRLEGEVTALAQDKRAAEAKIRQLEDRLEKDENTRADNERLRAKYMKCERDRKELESELTRHRTEHYDETQNQTLELNRYRNMVEEYEKEWQLAKQRWTDELEKKNAQISRLEEVEQKCYTESETSRATILSLQNQAQVYEEQVADMTGKLEKYRGELLRANDELRLAREKDRDRSESSGMHVQRLNRRIEELENELAKLAQKHEQASQQTQQELSATRLLSHDLDNTRDELAVAKRKAARLEQDLAESEAEGRAQQRQISSLKSSVQRLQSNAKRFDLAVKERKDFGSLVDALKDQNNDLNDKLVKTQRERDACKNCLEQGRLKLSQIAKKGEGLEMLETQVFGALEPAMPSPAVAERGELFVTDYSIGHFFSTRAEEIASCLATSAKISLQDSQDENSNLRCRMYSLREEKEAQVAALKTRIRHLENEVRSGNDRTPQRYFGR